MRALCVLSMRDALVVCEGVREGVRFYQAAVCLFVDDTLLCGFVQEELRVSTFAASIAACCGVCAACASLAKMRY
jgi:hypothetical protein